MSLFADMSPSARRSALAVMMLAILLLGTAIAWVIVIARPGVRPGETWYLITSGDTPIGWHVSQQEMLSNGDGKGYDIVYTLVGDGSSMVSFSEWRLNAAATEGQYASELVRSGRRRASSTGVTHVEYDHPTVSIHLEREGQPVRATEPQEVGQTYIPEGGMNPAIVQVAKTGRPFTGEMVKDADMALRPVMIQPDGHESRNVGGRPTELSAVTFQWLDDGLDVPLFRFLVAGDGSIPMIERVDVDGRAIQVYTRTSLDVVRSRFPSAHRLRNSLLEQSPID